MESIVENTKVQMRKGILELCILGVISKGEVYTSDILESLKESKLLVVKGTIDQVIDFPGGSSQAFLNEKLKAIDKTKINSVFEVSAAYNWNKLYFQSSIDFNKFVNTNFSIHYRIN